VSRRGHLTTLLIAIQLAMLVAVAPTASAAQPPWCGDPVPDAAANLPDGTQPGDPVGSFPHIPVYAFACTLADIQARSDGRMITQVTGQSADGHDMYLVTINALDTSRQRQDFHHWQDVRKIALTDPERAQALAARYGDDLKVPIFIQSAIHGNEYEGVDAMFDLVERLATTPYGQDPDVDAILDHVILLWNVDQNPDGRVLGQRANGNNFDLNRDFLTQSQPETKISVSIMQEWLPPDILDQHGYVTPTLIESTTKPHNPSIDYDLWLKWNPSRIDANEAAMNAVHLGVTRPILDWCSNASPPPPSGICSDGSLPGPDEAEGWDDWGPFYTPMYSQLVGLNGSTVEMCNSTSAACGVDGSTDQVRGRLGAKLAQYTVAWSTLLFDLQNRQDLLHDELETYRRGVTNAARPDCCDPPYENQGIWMREYPKGYLIPLGEGQRSDPEANRLVDWLLQNGIVVEELKQDAEFDGTTYQKGSYVVWMTQAHRGLADTALSIGTNLSGTISRLYAPPAAWSHGFLWGADAVVVPRDSTFDPITNRVTKSSHLLGGVEPGVADAYALPVDSPTAVRALNELLGDGLTADLATASFSDPMGDVLPAGTALFASDPATKVALDRAGKTNDVWFHRVEADGLPAVEPIDRVPHIAVLTGSVNQDVWSLRDLGFVADPISTQTINSAADDPLVGYDVVFNTGNYPNSSNVTGRARLQTFFANGGGYIGAGSNGANFLTGGALVSGLSAATRSGSGRSGIVNWVNEGGTDSPIVGAFPATDTAIMDPPTWFTGTGALSVDGRLPADPADIVASGLWDVTDAQSASAPGSPIIAHGTSDAGPARVTIFAMNPLYRADPEREWVMVGSAAYWADQ
jgi:hypothetical protein